MKKLLAITLPIILILMVCPYGMFELTATAETDGHYTYTVSNGEAKIANVDESISGDITIPPTLGGCAVTSIGKSAFSNCTGLTSITIPNSVTSIGGSAFSGCSSIEEITLPFVGDKRHTPTDKYQYPFGYIFGTTSYTGGTATTQYYYGSSTSDTTSKTYYIPSTLKKATITDSEQIPYGAFYNCSNLTSIEIPDFVTSIGDSAFRDCTGLTNITIPNSVTSLGNYAFYRCTGLTSITIPDSVTSIGFYVFRDCTGLTSVTIGNSVTSIGGFAFSGCTGLTSITIGNSVKTIGSGAFKYCKGLTSVTIGNSVTSIGGFAFSGCTGLTSVTIPNSVTSIGDYAFSGCSSLQEITLPFVGDKRHTLTDTYRYPFGYIFGTDSYTGGTATTQYYYGSSTSSTTNSTYYIPTSLKKVTITDSEQIPYGAFYNCSNLTSIEIPDSVTSIGHGAFSGCSSLQEITLPFVGNKRHTSSDTYQYPFGYIFGTSSYTGGTATKQYYYESSTSSTTNSTYYIPTTLKKVSITDSEYIPYGVFYNCSNLTSINIPDSVTSIGKDAFSGCSALKYNSLGKGRYLGNEQNPYLALISVDLSVFNDSFEIPSGVKLISVSAFSKCTMLTSVTIPDSVTTIGNYAFEGCTGLTNLTIGNSVESIGGFAFSGCTGLTSVTIPNSVTSIGNGAFWGCTGLTSITIPDSVTLIGFYAFKGCTGLTSVTIGNSVTSIGGSAFSGCTRLTSVTIPDSVTLIGGGAFRDCYGLTSIKIPDSVTSIGDYAFSGCSGLKSITIPNFVTSIGDYAFSGCSGLKIITIPNSITSIGDYAFSGCTGLKDIWYGGSYNDRGNIAVGTNNAPIISATWHFNTCKDGEHIFDSACDTTCNNCEWTREPTHTIVNGKCSVCGYIAVKVSFPDVNLKDWYGDAVSYAVSAGLMKGYASGKFGTADGIQRQDFVVILSRLSGDDLSQYEGKTSFKDVSKGAYYAAALAWAKAKGVSSGYANGKFGVGDKVTREQIMVFLYNYAKLKGYDTTATMTEAQAKATYADFGKVSGYAKEAALWALSKGVVSGKDAGGGKKLIAPQANALRCEVAAMFYNIEQKNIFAEE